MASPNSVLAPGPGSEACRRPQILQRRAASRQHSPVLYPWLEHRVEAARPGVLRRHSTRLAWDAVADPPVLAGFRRLRTVPFAPLNQRSAVSKLDPFCSRASTGFPSVSCDGVAARTERILSACSAASMARWRMPSGHGRRFGTSAVSDRRPIFGWRPRQALGLTACNPEGVPTTTPALPC